MRVNTGLWTFFDHVTLEMSNTCRIAREQENGLLSPTRESLTLTWRKIARKSAVSITVALEAIASQRFDILITDLHRSNPGEGFTVVTAMRHTQPWAMSVALNVARGQSASEAGALPQADKVLEKPLNVKQLVSLLLASVHDRSSL